MQLTPEGWPGFAWTAGTGWTYRVEWRADLGTGTWQKLAEVTSPGPIASFTDQTVGGVARRYYRVVFLHY